MKLWIFTLVLLNASLAAARERVQIVVEVHNPKLAKRIGRDIPDQEGPAPSTSEFCREPPREVLPTARRDVEEYLARKIALGLCGILPVFEYSSKPDGAAHRLTVILQDESTDPNARWPFGRTVMRLRLNRKGVQPDLGTTPGYSLRDWKDNGPIVMKPTAPFIDDTGSPVYVIELLRELISGSPSRNEGELGPNPAVWKLLRQIVIQAPGTQWTDRGIITPLRYEDIGHPPPPVEPQAIFQLPGTQPGIVGWYFLPCFGERVSGWPTGRLTARNCATDTLKPNQWPAKAIGAQWDYFSLVGYIK